MKAEFSPSGVYCDLRELPAAPVLKVLTHSEARTLRDSLIEMYPLDGVTSKVRFEATAAEHGYNPRVLRVEAQWKDVYTEVAETDTLETAKLIAELLNTKEASAE